MANRNKLPEGLVRRGNGYYAHFTVDGKRIRKLLSHDLRTAKMLLIELRARVQRGEHLLADVPSDTFEADADLPSGIRVYFLEAIGIEKIKIGVSGNLRNRLKQLENASPVPVRLLLHLPGGVDLEDRIHCALAEAHSHGEWYFATRQVRLYINRLITADE